MKKLMCLLLVACLLPLVALAEEAVLKDAENFWNETVHLWVSDGFLYMTLDGVEAYQPVKVKDGFVEAARALEEAGELTAVPDGMNRALYPLLDDSLTGGREVVSMDVHQHEIILLLEGPGDHRTLRIAQWNGTGYDARENGTFPQDTELDSIHFDDGEAFLWVYYSEGSASGVSFRRRGDEWVPSLEMNSSVWLRGWSTVIDPEQWSVGRNNGHSYGTLPEAWRDFEHLDIAQLPMTLEQALAQLDRTGWAVVNNPNPADRLHLRTEPGKGATSLGKFYNKTPVRVIDRRDEWSRVIIGEDGLTGWMMTAYLAFGEAADQVESAFIDDLFLTADESASARYARALPDMNADAVFELGASMREFIIGVVENEWFIVMDEDGHVGYVPQSWYEEGNG